MKYPNVDDIDFNKFINKNYKKYTIPKNKMTLKEYCQPKQFKLQLPQEFVSEFINPDTPYKGLIIFHKIGSGKTCSAISIAEQWKKTRKILVVLPAALIGNFRDELRSPCGGYLSKSDYKKIKSKPNTLDETEYNKIIKNSDKEINKYYNILSYHKFIEYVQNNKIC